MNTMKRAVLYITRKWKKSLIIFFIIFAASSLVLSGLAIFDAQEAQSKELRGATGVSFSVSRNVSTGGWSSGTGGSYSTQEFLSDEMLESIGNIDGIKGYNASVRTILSLADGDGKWMEQLEPTGYTNVDCQFYSYGCINSEYNSLFLSGALTLIEGTAIDPDSKNGILISEDMANKHHLKIGDSILAVNNPSSNDKTLELEIVGLFHIVADKTDEKNNYNEASYYDYANYAFVEEGAMKELLENYSDVGYSSADFFVSDPEQLETIIQKVLNIRSVNWDHFIISTNDEVYERVADSVSDMDSLFFLFIVLVTAVSVAVIILILSMWQRSRISEIGILLAVGITKSAILFQYVMETLLIGVVTFPAAYLFARSISGYLNGLFGKTAGGIQVTSQYFMLVTIAGCVLLVFSTLITCIPVMRYQPKAILSRME